jgi:hypothetical protein
MNKGLVDNFLGLYRGILQDAAVYYPIHRKEFEKDYVRLETLSTNMGERLFTMALPALGKCLDKAFSSGRLDFGGIALSRSVNRRTLIPRLFRGFWSLMFADDGCLKHDIDPQLVQLFRTVLLCGKKYLAECPDTATFAAVKEYFDVEQQLPPAPDLWSGDGSELSGIGSESVIDLLPIHHGLFRSSPPNGGDASLLRACQDVADRVSSLLGEFFPEEARFRHGPGAVSDIRTGRGYKYSFPSWTRKLQFVFPRELFGRSGGDWENDSIYRDVPFSMVSSRLIAVPKTQKGPRLIASEPTCNQWCQQAVRHSLTNAIRRTPIGLSIDFSKQELSGELALTASKTGALATIDLSSASDRLSCFVVQRLFRSNLSYLRAFIASRTEYLQQTIDKKSPKLHKLRKFASMGSALTFPVQSLCFLMVCVAAGKIATDCPLDLNSLKGLLRQVRVYGDDLIVPVSWVPLVERLMTLLFLRVNRDKTFATGKFRESCGTDGYDGTIVSPTQVRRFYEESAPVTIQSVVDASNNFYQVGLWRASHFLLRSLPSWARALIPTVGLSSGSFGFKSAMGLQIHSKIRWSESLHRWEYRTLKFSTKADNTMKHEGFANLLQYFTEDPSGTSLISWESGVFAKPLVTMNQGWSPV